MVGQELSSGPAAYALVGMGSMAAAVLGAPISTTLIIFELTGDYTVTIAAMAGVVIATMVSTHLYGQKSFFLAKLRHNGIELAGGQDVSGLKGTTAKDCLAPSISTCKPNTTRADVRSTLLSNDMDEIFVVDGNGGFVGVVSGSDLAVQQDTDTTDTVADLIHIPKSMVMADETIENAVRSLLAAKADRLPVIENEETRKLIGLIAARDLLRSVNLALHEALADEEEDSNDSSDTR